MYTLVNAEERNAQYPTTFHIRSRADREDLRVTDFVKMIFEYPSGRSERMWVRILEVLPGPRFSGVLDNDPFYPDEAPKAGDTIEFGPENITAILDRPN
jgi:hypothetical protein